MHTLQIRPANNTDRHATHVASQIPNSDVESAQPRLTNITIDYSRNAYDTTFTLTLRYRIAYKIRF